MKNIELIIGHVVSRARENWEKAYRANYEVFLIIIYAASAVVLSGYICAGLEVYHKENVSLFTYKFLFWILVYLYWAICWSSFSFSWLGRFFVNIKDWFGKCADKYEARNKKSDE